MTDRWNKIIAKKIEKVQNNPFFKIAKMDAADNSKYIIKFTLDGGHYKGQTHILYIDLKRDKPESSPIDWFPVLPPKVYFKTKIFHTNISPASGWICLDILQDKWSPINNIDTIVSTIVLLLDDPAPTGNHLNATAAQLQQSCQRQFNIESKNLNSLYGAEYDALYNKCFSPFDICCQNEYAHSDNEVILKQYNELFD